MHLACDGKGRPLSVVLTPGQRNDGTQLEAVLDAIRVPRSGRGRPRKRPERLLADRGYGKGLYRRMLKARGIPHTIPSALITVSGAPSRRGDSWSSTRISTRGATWWRGA